MKKHILGFAIFNFIVVSFGLIYAFLYVPAIPRVEEVKAPLTPVYNSYSSKCRKNKMTPSRRISSEIITSHHFYYEDKIVTRIRVTLDEAANLPDKIYVTANYSITGDIARDGFGDVQIIENPFSSGLVQEFTVVTRVSPEAKVDPQDNLYVLISVTDYDSTNQYKTREDVTQAREVTTIYGKKSEIRVVKEKK